jgi:hypothetical protein
VPAISARKALARQTLDTLHGLSAWAVLVILIVIAGATFVRDSSARCAED